MARQKRPFDAVQFTRESAERVARVVRDAETAPPQVSALTFERRISDRIPKQVRLALFSGPWGLNQTKTVTFVSQPAVTANVLNRSMIVHMPAYRYCVVGKEGTSWHLIAAYNEQIARGTFTAPWAKDASATITLRYGFGTVAAVNDYVSTSGTGTKKCTIAHDGAQWHLIAAECS